MKIHEKTVYSMETLEVIEDVSYEYEGEVALCGSGGGSTTTTTTIPDKTETELALDDLNLKLTQKKVDVESQLLEYQKQSAEWQNKFLPQYLANQEMLLPAQKAEMEFYTKSMPQQLAIAGKQLGITEKQIALQEELLPLNREVATLQLELAKKALAGEPLATEEQKRTLRTMTDQFKENATAGLKDVGETLYEQAVQKGLSIGMPLSDIAEGFKEGVGKYIASERSSIEREGERMYTSGLTSYPTAMAEFGQRISGGGATAPMVSSGGYATPPMNQVGGGAQLPTSVGGMDSLNQILAQLKQERYGMASTETRAPSQSNWPSIALGLAGGIAGYALAPATGGASLMAAAALGGTGMQMGQYLK